MPTSYPQQVRHLGEFLWLLQEELLQRGGSMTVHKNKNKNLHKILAIKPSKNQR